MRALLVVALVASSTVAADANPLLADCPAIAGEDGRLCKSLHTGVDIAARLCRNADAPSVACDAIDHEPAASIDAYLAGSTHAAMDARFHADDALPIKLARWPSTHNSYNAEAYAPTFSGLDANQVHSIYDQLRMDMRAIELDAHWWPSANAPPMAPVMCHAEDAGNGVHAGCTTERTLAKGLNELVFFLRQDAAADEVVLLYIEDHLDGPDGREAAAELLAELDPMVYRPADSGRACEDGLPLERSRADVLAAGKRILIVASNCGEGAWSTYVHSYDASIDQHGVEELTPYPDCGGPGVAYGEKIVRFYEDRTWLTTMASGPQREMTPEAVRELARCGANMIGFDFLTPDDGRLDALAGSE